MTFDIDGDNIRNLSPRQVNTKYGSLRGTIVTLAPNQPISNTHSYSPTLPSIEAYLGLYYISIKFILNFYLIF
jgi:hypothetical protein